MRRRKQHNTATRRNELTRARFLASIVSISKSSCYPVRSIRELPVHHRAPPNQPIHIALQSTRLAPCHPLQEQAARGKLRQMLQEVDNTNPHMSEQYTPQRVMKDAPLEYEGQYRHLIQDENEDGHKKLIPPQNQQELHNPDISKPDDQNQEKHMLAVDTPPLDRIAYSEP